MRTIVIIGGIVLAGATTIAVMMSERNEAAQPVNTSQGISPAAVNGEAPKLNPAHGLPGHRCDLAVGAPLTTASGTSTPTAPPPVINMNQQPAPAGLKVNPAHGMPGHRCDLQVGAPL